MPISDSIRSVFIHVPKTAGSSIEKAFGIYGRNNRGNNEQICPRILYGRHLQHLTARELRLVAPLRFRRYFKFAFVRNPWERIYSEYRWRQGFPNDSQGLDFGDFLKLAFERLHDERHLRPQSDYVTDGRGNLLVDFVGRFERLSEDFGRMCASLGVNLTLFHENRSSTPADSYRNHYSPAQRDTVAAMYAVDIDRFGYQF